MLLTWNNVAYYQHLMQDIREAIESGTFTARAAAIGESGRGRHSPALTHRTEKWSCFRINPMRKREPAAAGRVLWAHAAVERSMTGPERSRPQVLSELAARRLTPVMR